jgi:DNA-binding HxlR family transcriptional regulator
MQERYRSRCPINMSVEVFGDRWTLLIIRDMMFGGKRHFRELQRSEEHISSNILADRLARLVEEGIVTKRDDPSHKQKAIYSLTEKGIDLLPVLAQIGAWGVKYLPVSDELGVRARLLADGGPERWDRFMDELRETHLGIPAPARNGPPVMQQLREAYLAAREPKKEAGMA